MAAIRANRGAEEGDGEQAAAEAAAGQMQDNRVNREEAGIREVCYEQISVSRKFFASGKIWKMTLLREKGRNLTQSYEKCLYTYKNKIQKAT